MRRCGVDAMLPTGRVCINTVGQFRRLMQDAEGDTQLRKQLQQVRVGTGLLFISSTVLSSNKSGASRYQ